MIAVVASIRAAFHLPYRQLAGTLQEMMPDHKTPDYTTIQSRIFEMNITVHEGLSAIHSKNEHALLIVDATGLKQGNCVEWIRQKWRIRRGFIKLHLLMGGEDKGDTCNQRYA